MRSRTALAAGLASVCTAALGGSVLSAHADVRTFSITLSDGRVLELTVDVPPQTDVWKIDFPDVDEQQIVAIAEEEEPAPDGATATPTEPQPQPQPQPPAPLPPEPQPQPQLDPQPGGWTPKPDLVEQDPGGKQPAADDGARRQRTTGRERQQRARRRAARDRNAAAAGDPARERSTRPGEAGLPTAADPTTSIAVPGAAPIGVPNFFIDKFRIPPFLLSIYQAAGIEYGVRWEVLAAINEIETDYGRNLNVSSAGAVGWMQFMPATWRQYGVDANGDRKKDPY
ncbi:MAG TPA: lytic transglycosylase domain-containing protein, partial [Solirubrobacteraceae bacterium]|nr:lytic transglycosylase domain-containing protein [Solirubrobacteraceae bacterium]